MIYPTLSNCIKSYRPLQLKLNSFFNKVVFTTHFVLRIMGFVFCSAVGVGLAFADESDPNASDLDANASGTAIESITEIATKSITINDAWIRLVPPVSNMTAGYMTLVNNANQDDQLLSVSSSLAQKIELHESVKTDDGVDMIERQTLEIPANAKATLAPGGIHLMIMGLKQPTQKDSYFQLQLRFEQAGVISINVPVLLDFN